MNKFFIILIIILSSCNQRNNHIPTKVKESADFFCPKYEKNSAAIRKLLTNAYAKAVSDSFIVSSYSKYADKKIRSENKGDSIRFSSLKIIPYIIAEPYGDSSAYELMYVFTDNSCTSYYDSVLKADNEFKGGMRFSLVERRVIYFITGEGKPVRDRHFFDAGEKNSIKNF